MPGDGLGLFDVNGFGGFTEIKIASLSLMTIRKNKPLGHIEKLSERKHKSIVKAAQRIFMQEGYNKAPMAQIAKAADVSTATLYNHFPSKQALFGAVMRDLWEYLQLNINEEKLARLDVREGLIKIGTRYAEFLNQDIMHPLFRVIIAEAETFTELGRELYEQGKKPYLDRIEAYLKAKTRDGILKVDNAEIATRQFLGMINDVVFWPRFLVVDLKLSKSETKKVVKEAVETFLARYMRE